MRPAILLLFFAAPATAADLTTKQLQAVMPHLPDDRAATFVKPLNDAMREFDVTTAKRQSAFVAQIAHESGELKYMEEIASGEA